jgi:hypothetical protein
MKKLKTLTCLTLTKDTLRLLDSPDLRTGMREVAGGITPTRCNSGQICC